MHCLPVPPCYPCSAAAAQVLLKLAQASPGAVVAALDSLIDPLDKTVMKKPPVAAPSSSSSSAGAADSAASGPEIERAQELVRSGVKVVVTLSRLCADQDLLAG